MSSILAIENKVPKEPYNVSWESLVLDLGEEFNDILQIQHQPIKLVEDGEPKIEQTIVFEILFLRILLLLGLYILLKKRKQ